MPTHAGYAALGWSTIPLTPKTKVPIESWKKYQTRKPNKKEIAKWDQEAGGWPQLAVVCGTISGIIVMDVDEAEGWAYLEGKHLPVTPCARSSPGWPANPNGKMHYYFKHPGGVVANLVHGTPGSLPGIDIRGDGGYVVLPNSAHPKGHRYEWVPGLSPEEVDLAPCPDWLLAALKWRLAPPGTVTIHAEDQLPPDDDWVAKALQGAAEGQRDVTLTRLVGYWFGRGLKAPEVLQMANLQNSMNRPPLPITDVAKIVKSIERREISKPAIPPITAPQYSQEWREQREGQLATIASVLDVPITEIKKVTGSDPKLLITLDHEWSVLCFTHAQLMSQPQFRSKFALESGKIPKHLGTKPLANGFSEWDRFVQTILAVADIADAGEEATDSGEIKHIVADYLQQFPPEDCTDGRPPALVPFLVRKDAHHTDTYLYLKEFTAFCVASGIKVDGKTVAQRLRLLGCAAVTVSVRGYRAAAWRLSPRLIPEPVPRDDKKEAAPNEAAQPEDAVLMH